jgi:DNA-binding transcriptional LysR family regulator
MTLEQLRIFVAVAERQQIARAAAALRLPQNSVNAAITALETRRGTKLFHRAGGGIQLSDAGSLFLREARALLARAKTPQNLQAESDKIKRSVLRVQASETIASHFLPRHLVALRRAHRHIEIRLAIGNTAQVAAALHANEADLGFIEGDISDPGLAAESVARESTIVVVGANHPWCRSADIGARDFMDADWLLREPGCATRTVFESAMAALGVPPADLRVALEVPSNEALRAAVEAVLGAAAISASAAAPGLQAGLLHHVPFDLPDRTYTAVRRADREVSRAAERLLEIIRGK